MGQLVTFIKVLTKPHGLTNAKDQNNDILLCRLVTRNLNNLKTKKKYLNTHKKIMV